MPLLTLLASAALAVAPNSTLFSDARPPAVFRHDATVTVEFAGQDRINARCQDLYGKPPSGIRTEACATGAHLIMPNPCNFPDSDAYAHLLCHELGHVNGWPATHGDFGPTLAGNPVVAAGLNSAPASPRASGSSTSADRSAAMTRKPPRGAPEAR